MDEKNPIGSKENVPQQSGSPEYFSPLTSGQYPLAHQSTKPPLEQPAQNIPKKNQPIQIHTSDIVGNQGMNSTAPGTSPLETLRTFKNDVAEAVKNQKASVITVAVAEQKRKIERHEPVAAPRKTYTESRKNLLKFFLSLFLIVGGLTAGAYAYFIYLIPKDPVSIILPGNPLIGSNSQKEISIDSKSQGDILYLISNEKNQNQPIGSVESIYFTKNVSGEKTIIGLGDFLKTIGVAMPETLTRSLGSDFMLGLHMIKGGKLFLILTPTYYEGSFPAMLEWEKTMAGDLAGIFNKQISTSSPIFIDKVIRNKDARVQYDEIGNTVVLYSFTDKQHIVIAEDEETLIEVARRLTETAKVVK